MLGHNGFLFLAVVSFPLPLPAPLAYVGLGPGQELIPYFFALLAMIGAAIVAVLQWPAAAVLRWLRAKGGPKGGPDAPAALADAPEKTGECIHDKP